MSCRIGCKGLLYKWCLLVLLSVVYIIIISALQKRVTKPGQPSKLCTDCERQSSTLEALYTNNTALIPDVPLQYSNCRFCSIGTNDTKYNKELNSTHMAPAHVLIIAYQRTGSSFFGQIFNQYPGAFFSFEPLDGAFSHLYGTLQGWNVPSDITSNADGSHRSMTKFEHAEIVKTLSSLLTCRLQDLSTEVLLHTFWLDFPKQHANTNFYSHCLKSLRVNIHRCFLFLRRACPAHYDSTNPQMLACHKYIHHSDSDRMPIPIANFKKCTSTLRARAAPCIRKLQEHCESSPIKATKVVRPAMETVLDLLKLIPDLKVIHLVRDPRDVTVSRMLMQSAHGRASELHVRSMHEWPLVGNNNKQSRQVEHIASALPIEAKVFCQNVLSDVKDFYKFSLNYTSSFFRLRYEDYISSSLTFAHKIYDFIGKKMPSELQMWLKSSVSSKSQWKWKQRNKDTMEPYFEEVLSVCKEFYALLYPDIASVH